MKTSGERSSLPREREEMERDQLPMQGQMRESATDESVATPGATAPGLRSRQQKAHPMRRSDDLANRGDEGEDDVEWDAREDVSDLSTVAYHPDAASEDDRATIGPRVVHDATAKTFEAQTTRDPALIPGAPSERERDRAIIAKGSVKGSPLPEDEGARG